MTRRIPYVDIRGYHKGVTGSCIRVTYHSSYGDKFRFLVDDGMYQGEGVKQLSYNDCVTPKKINAVLLTHTHLDHNGALPAFVRQGYEGPIYMSDASQAVIDIGLEDSYNIMKRDSKIKKQPILFSPTDIKKTMEQIISYPFDKSFQINDNISVIFFNNGHLIGASIILVQINDPVENINLLFTGDYKPYNAFLDIRPLPDWVYNLPNLTIITESTYGTTNTSDIQETWRDDIANACSKEKIIFNCAFGQGRAQELLYYIRQMEDEGTIPKDYPVFLDGTSANAYTFRYLDRANIIGLKEDARDFFPYNIQFLNTKSRPTVLANNRKKIIISTSGMGSHGPAAVYIPHYITNPNALIYFPGYTAQGTLGRKVYEAEEGSEIQFINGSTAIKRATVLQTSEFSSHAKADELIDFINRFHPTSVLINHGEPEVKEQFKPRVEKEVGLKESKVGILGMGFVYRINQFGIDKKIQK